jgi:lipoprotein-releasing system ATP-binding protein
MNSLIETEKLQKTFRTEAGELGVLKGIDLSIIEGEMVGIEGASGAGKSTLLHIIGALDRPTSGKVSFQGTDIFSLSADSLASFRNMTLGFVFQFHHLLPEFTALENVMMPGIISKSAQSHGSLQVKDNAKKLLNEMGLSQRHGHRPGELSGGEQQRVAVARALILNPKVVLADEPTGNLDTQTGEELFELLVRINRERGTTFVIVTHNKSLSLRCHRVLRMADGIVV